MSANPPAFASALDQLQAELRVLEALLRRHIFRMRSRKLITDDEFRGLYIPDALADSILSQAEPGAPAADPFTHEIERMRRENSLHAEAAAHSGIDLPLTRAARQFGLSRLECDVWILGAAPELDLRYEVLYAYAQNDITRKRPTVELALELLCGSFEERCERRRTFAAGSALRREGLIRLVDDAQDPDAPLPARMIRVDTRVAGFLAGQDEVDECLLPVAARIRPTLDFQSLELPDALKARLEAAVRTDRERRGTYFLQGPAGVGKRAAAEAMCHAWNLPLLMVDLRRLDRGGDLTAIAAKLRREAALQPAALYLNHFHSLLSAEGRGIELFEDLSRCPCPLFVSSEVSWQPPALWADSRFLSFSFALPDYPLRVRLWDRALGAIGSVNPAIDIAGLADRFALSPRQILASARQAGALAVLRSNGDGITSEDVTVAARAHSSPELRRLAQKVDCAQTWADLVLPPRPLQQLKEVLVSMQYRHVVHFRWGFSNRLALGKGLSALFSGPSGTGKTMAAGILARELCLDLYRIDLAGVVSKYIGETEKNLSAIFREAQSSNAILFFDEADALFGKRSEVKDAHDRYANIEVAYLLQRIEEYEGVVILATNFRKNIDEAFARRIQHTVDFPFPDAPHRERLWRGIFPAEAPLDPDLDFRFLAEQFELAGGNIRNVALAAAFFAAEQHSHIGMSHVIQATAREVKKIGKLPSRFEFGQYFDSLRDRPETVSGGEAIEHRTR